MRPISSQWPAVRRTWVSPLLGPKGGRLRARCAAHCAAKTPASMNRIAHCILGRAPLIAKNTHFCDRWQTSLPLRGAKARITSSGLLPPAKAAMSGGSIGTSPSMGHTRSVETAGSCDDAFFHSVFIGIPTAIVRWFVYLICCRCFCRADEKEAEGSGSEPLLVWRRARCCMAGPRGGAQGGGPFRPWLKRATPVAPQRAAPRALSRSAGPVQRRCCAPLAPDRAHRS